MVKCSQLGDNGLFYVHYKKYAKKHVPYILIDYPIYFAYSFYTKHNTTSDICEVGPEVMAEPWR